MTHQHGDYWGTYLSIPKSLVKKHMEVTVQVVTVMGGGPKQAGGAVNHLQGRCPQFQVVWPTSGTSEMEGLRRAKDKAVCQACPGAMLGVAFKAWARLQKASLQFSTIIFGLQGTGRPRWGPAFSDGLLQKGHEIQATEPVMSGPNKTNSYQ